MDDFVTTADQSDTAHDRRRARPATAPTRANGDATHPERTVARRSAIAVTVALSGAIALAGFGSTAAAAGATQVSGSTTAEECTAPPAGFEASQDPSTGYAFAVDGDLEGCLYGVITVARFHEGGMTYQERADEIFVRSADPDDTFRMTESYTAKLDPDNTTTGLFFARCKHPIVAGSGTGAFEGVSGRLDFKDDVVAGAADYTGHLRFG